MIQAVDVEHEVQGIRRTASWLLYWLEAFSELRAAGLSPQAAYEAAQEQMAAYDPPAEGPKGASDTAPGAAAPRVLGSPEISGEDVARVGSPAPSVAGPLAMAFRCTECNSSDLVARRDGDGWQVACRTCGAIQQALRNQAGQGQDADQDQQQQDGDLGVDGQDEGDQNDGDDQHDRGQPVTESESSQVHGSVSTPVRMEPQPCRHKCGQDVWYASHYMTRGSEMFELLPASDGECMIDFATGLYEVLQPTVGAGGRGKRRRRAPGATPNLSLQGPFRYHASRCEAAAKQFGWDKRAPE